MFPLKVQVAIEGALGSCVFLGKASANSGTWCLFNDSQAIQVQ